MKKELNQLLYNKEYLIVHRERSGIFLLSINSNLNSMKKELIKLLKLEYQWLLDIASNTNGECSNPNQKALYESVKTVLDNLTRSDN